SISYTLPGGERTTLRELKVRPRSTRWNLAIGSLWFDVASGQLVKAIYRLASPMDFLLLAEEEAARDSTRRRPDVNPIARAIMTPFVGQISAVEVEYALYKARFWLPRTRTASGTTQANFVRLPFTLQQTFQYASV